MITKLQKRRVELLHIETHLNKRTQSVRVQVEVGSMTSEEIEVKRNELFQKVDGVWKCLKCDYKTKK